MEIIGAIIIVVAVYVVWCWIRSGKGFASDIVNIISWGVRKLWPIIALILVGGVILASTGML